MFKENRLICLSPSEGGPDDGGGPEKGSLPGYIVTNGSYKLANRYWDQASAIAFYLSGELADPATRLNDRVKDLIDDAKAEFSEAIDNDENVVMIDLSGPVIVVHALKGEVSAKIRNLLKIEFNGCEVSEEIIPHKTGKQYAHPNHNAPDIIQSIVSAQAAEKVITSCQKRIDQEDLPILLERTEPGSCILTYISPEDGTMYTLEYLSLKEIERNKVAMIFRVHGQRDVMQMVYPGEDLADMFKHFVRNSEKGKEGVVIDVTPKSLTS